MWGEIQDDVKMVNKKGTSIDDIYYKKEQLILHIFNHRKFVKEEIEKAITEALEKKIIIKSLVDNEIRYVIDDSLREFVSFCWEQVFMATRSIVRDAFVLKRLSKNSPEYKKFYDWLTRFEEEKDVKFILNEYRNFKRKDYVKQKFIQEVKWKLNNIEELKKRATAIYEKNVNKKDSVNYGNLNELLLHYTCPQYVINSVKCIVEDISKK